EQRLPRLQELERLQAAAAGSHVEPGPLGEPPHDVEHGDVIVHDQHDRFAHAHTVCRSSGAALSTRPIRCAGRSGRRATISSSLMRRIPLSAIRDAADAIYPVARRTPLVRLELPESLLARLAGSEVYLKLELLQPIGSF